MDITDDLTFNEWFDSFVGKCKELNYTGPIDKYTFEADYLENKTPEAAAKEFVDEVTGTIDELDW